MAIELSSQFIFAGSVLALLCIFASILSRRFGAPLLLVFLILGMLAGEDGPGGLIFNDFSLAFLLGNLALAIIIFDGGLGTRKSTFRVSLKPALSLATVGVLVTAAITGFFAHWLLDLSWQEGLLIGAIVGSTDAAAVFGLLRTAGLNLKERAGATLEIESGSNDPMAIFLTIAMVHLIVQDSSNPGWSFLVAFVQQIGLGTVIGLSGGYLLTQLLKRLNLPSALYPLLALAGGLSVFGLANLLGGSGFLAIYLVGVLVGNAPLPYGNDIHRFHDGIAWLSQIGMFLMLGLLITPSHLPPIILPAIAIAAVLIFVARPVAVLLSLLPFRFPWREQVFVGWCGLRGAVPFILALFPSLAGMENTATYFELVFFVVLVSLLLQGWTIAPMARWLGIDLPPLPHDPTHLSLTVSTEQQKELLIYEMAENTPVLGMSQQKLPMMQGAQVVGIIRQGVLVEDTSEQILELNDQLLILALSDTTASLNYTYASPRTATNLEMQAYLGTFAIKPQTKLQDLSLAYGFEVKEDLKSTTIAHYIENKFYGKPVVGDRVQFGSVKFVVRELVNGKITVVGLKLSS
jgi:cell volume regulation protein A